MDAKTRNAHQRESESGDRVRSNKTGMTAASISINAGMALSARVSSPLSKSFNRLSKVVTLFRGRRDGQFTFSRFEPLIPFFDQHDGYIIHNGIFAAAIPTDKP